jgi:uncharacterized protein YdeI (YjbR/CyaY-like superfamily)
VENDPILSFASARAFEAWLSKNHKTSTGIWLKLTKAAHAKDPLTYPQVVDVVLCYGWIDGQKRKNDATSWLQRVLPRRPRSIWSKTNTENALRLMREKRMRPAGLAQIEAAKKDGRWKAAYDSGANSKIPEDFLKELRRDPKALAFFEGLNRANLYAITFRLQTAKKPETRERRMKQILKMMAEEKKFHP